MWLQIVLLILQLLRDYKSSESADAFVSAVKQDSRLQSVPFANGDILKWIWEHREEIVAFIKQIMEWYNKQPVIAQSDMDQLVQLEALLAELDS